MDIEKTLQTLKGLAAGHDPLTGLSLDRDHVCQSPDVIRALHHALEFVEREARRERRLQRARISLPSNTGKAWTSEEDRVLVHRFRTGCCITDIATLHARTTGSIQARLEKLRQIEPRSPEPATARPRHTFSA